MLTRYGINRLVHPFGFPGTWSVTLVFAAFLLLGHLTVRLLLGRSTA